MKQITFKQKVVQGIYDLFYVWKQELRNLFRDQGVLIFFVLVPLTYPLIYSFIYTNETVREVPAVVVDNSRSSLSREYTTFLDESHELKSTITSKIPNICLICISLIFIILFILFKFLTILFFRSTKDV